MAALATVCPRAQLRSEVSGMPGAGVTVKKPGVVVSVAVTLRTTALARAAIRSTPPSRTLSVS